MYLRPAKLLVIMFAMIFLSAGVQDAFAQQTTAATGGTGISADDTGGAYTSLTGPIMTETAPGQISLGLIQFLAPNGFEWNASSTPAVTVSLAPGQNGKTQLQVSFLRVNADTVTFQVTRPSDDGGNRAGELTFSGFQIRPTSGVFPNTGKIFNVGGAGPGGNTNYGDLSIVKGAAAKVRVETASDGTGSVVPTRNLTAGNDLTVHAISRDQFNNFLQNVSATWELINGSGNLDNSDLSISGISNSSPNTTLNSTLVGSGQIEATSGGLNKVPSGTITVVPDVAANLQIHTQPPVTATAGQVFSTSPQVKVVDVYGNTRSSDFTTQISVSRNKGSGTLQGTKTVQVSGGIATFSTLNHLVANTINLSFSASGFSSVFSNDIVVSPANAAALNFAVQPPNGSRNNALSPAPEVQVVDVYGNSVSQTVTVDMSINTGPGSFTNNSTTQISTNTSGRAVFSDLAFDTKGDYIITASDNAASLNSVNSNQFSIFDPGILAKFLVEAQGGGNITNKTAGQQFIIKISALDGNNNLLDGSNPNRPEYTGKAYITVPGNSGTGINDSTIAFSGGTVTDTLTLETAGDFEIFATKGSVSNPSNTFTISPAAPSTANSIVTAAPTSIVANGSSTSLITLSLFDSFGNALTSSASETIALTTDYGSLIGSITDNGNGTYEQSLQSITTVGTANVSATIDGASVSSSVQVNFVAGGLSKFAVETAGGGTIGTQTAGSSFNIRITAQDDFNNRVTHFNGSVLLTSNKNIDSGGGNVSLTNGVVDNYAVTINTAGQNNVTLTATNTNGSQTGTSNTFTINPAATAPSTTTITPGKRFLLNDGSSTTTITVQAKDIYGNNVLTSGEPVSLTINLSSSGTTLNPSGNTTNGVYQYTLTSTTTIQDANISGTINGNNITDTAIVTFVEFNTWTSSGGGGSNPSDWTRAGNWTLGVPTGSQAVIIPSNPVNNSRFPIILTTVNIAFLEINSGATVNVDPGGDLTVTGELTGAGALIVDDAKFTASGDISIGNLNAGNSTVVLNGSSQQNISGSIISDTLRISNTSTGGVVTGYINAASELNIVSGSNLSLEPGSTMELYGNLTGGGTLNTDDSQILIGGNVSLTGADFSNSDVTLNGTTAQTVSASLTYRDLNITNTSAVVTVQDATVNSVLTVNSGATLQINGNLTAASLSAAASTIRLTGDLNVTNINSAPETVVFNGTVNQNIASFSDFTNLTVNKSSGELISNDDLTVAGTLTLTAGDLVIRNSSLLADTRSISSGAIRFQRTLDTQGWYAISSPNSSTLGDFLDGTVTQGFSGATYPTGSLPGDTLQPNVFTYDESFDSVLVNGQNAPATDNSRWVPVSSASSTVSTATGYFLYVFGSISTDSKYNQALPNILDVGGTEHSGNISLPVTYTASVGSDAGWNLVGNPFGATIDWDDNANWTKTNMDNTIYVWDNAANGGNGGYLVWNGVTGSLGSGLLPPYQGFWVKASSSSPALSVTESAKTSGGTFYKESKEDQDRETESIELILKMDELESRSYLMFSEEAKLGKDAYDAFRLVPFTGTFLNLYTLVDDQQMVINNLPRKFGKALEVPLYLDAFRNGFGTGGTATLSLNGFEDLPESWVITLHDLQTKKKITLSNNKDYTFQLNSTGKSATYNSHDSNLKVLNNESDDPRFSLIIDPGADALGLPDSFELYQNYPNPFNPSTNIQFDLPVADNVRLEIFDILGRKVRDVVNQELSAGTYTFNVGFNDLSSGMYIYRLRTSEGVFTQKMILIK